MIRGIIFPTQDVVWTQGRDQNLLDIGPEYLAVDRPVDDPGGGDPVMAQRGDEGHGVPMPEWGAAAQTFALCRPTPQRGHVGLGPCFINEHKALWISFALMFLPPLALAGHVRAILLTGERGFS